ncbi:hypothetical protein RUM44_012708 [Polyplax serrata]|uniref:Fibroblast growth factor n=1 Tax=Polyplax serrata TaxID=468196 RepID=A0ABR1BFV7_POLSC
MGNGGGKLLSRNGSKNGGNAVVSTDSSSDVSEDSEPEVDDEPDESVRKLERSRRDVRSGSCPSGSGLTHEDNSISHVKKRNFRPKWLKPGFRFNLFRGNPVFSFRMQLYCRTGFFLAIFPDKKVRGTDEDANPNALVEFTSESFGEVRIKGIRSNLFLAMNKKGRLYGEANAKDEATVFVELVYGQYNLYLSRKWAHLGWYVGIKKSGKGKPGPQTRYGQKAIQFLPRRKQFW